MMTHLTSFEENRLKLDFKAINRGIFTGFTILLVLIGLFLFVGPVFSATPFTDDFEDYNLGNLYGQGDWATTTTWGEYVQVSDNFARTGSQSMTATSSITSDYYGIKRVGDEISSGFWSFSVMPRISNQNATSEIMYVFIEDDEGSACQSFHFTCSPTGCDDGILLKYCTIGGAQAVATLPLNEWSLIQIEFEASTNQSRVRINQDDWTIWDSCYTNEWDYVNQFNFSSGQNSGGFLNLYIDKISARCSPGYCNLCYHYESCINAGCSWYYSIYLQESYCVDYYEAEDEECGSFFKCQFCTTSELCEAELNCEWTDIGFGERCYMVEPTIPPVQEAWEVPAIEDCEELSGVEKWLCEIKNFIAGIFMPSQTKIDALFQTIGAFKQKLPFNYLAEMSTFFDAIRTDLNDEKEIPITILGQESNVNFTFWSATTTIGGQVETFKNILIDFSSLIIIFSWFAWLLSLIRRFFR